MLIPTQESEREREKTWYLYEMVAQNTVRSYGVNKVFWFVVGIWLHLKSGQMRFLFGQDLYYFIRAKHVLSYHLIQAVWIAKMA